MLSKYNKCWVVVADSGQARIFNYERAGHKLEQLSLKTTFDYAPLAAEMSEPESGRVFDRFGRGRHAVERSHGAEDKIRALFFKDLIGSLEHDCQEGNFEHLVLIADPRSLGYIRDHLSDRLKKSIIDEIALDLTNIEAKDLSERLSERLCP